MQFNQTSRGYQAVNEAGRTVAVITTTTEGVRATPPAMGVAAKPAVPPGPLPQDEWTFEFVGRPIKLADLKELVEKLPR